jgi:hypothetical protein
VTPIVCRSATATGSWLVGPAQLSSASGLPESAASAPPAPAAGLLACACSACGSANAPFTRCPGAVALGSATDSAASPAVLSTSAVSSL